MPHTESASLDLSEIERSPSSYVDPNGYVFEYEGRIYRAIRKAHVAYVQGLFDAGVVSDLVENHHLVGTEVSDLKIADPDVGLVLAHERIAPQTYCVEWCPEMLREAGLATVDLSLVLLEHDALLQDAYPWNLVFAGTRPYFVDFTSIVKIDTPHLWPAHEQFESFFTRPLLLSSQHRGDIARGLMINNITGITREAAYRNFSSWYKLTHPGAWLGYKLDEAIQRRPKWKRRLREAAQKERRFMDNNARRVLFRGLRSKLENLAGKSDRADVWADYYQEIDAGVDKDAKVKAIGELLKKARGETVVDLGCNTGVFSLLAAETGARVVSIDSSESCINRLYSQAKAKGARITPLISDLLCPTPPFGFMGRQYPGLVERAKSDVALCLAVMHHLHISGRQSFDRIAQLMDGFSKKHLIFEFVSMEDSNNSLLGVGRKIDYDLDTVVGELVKYFPHVETFPSDRETRKLLMCSKSNC